MGPVDDGVRHRRVGRRPGRDEQLSSQVDECGRENSPPRFFRRRQLFREAGHHHVAHRRQTMNTLAGRILRLSAALAMLVAIGRCDRSGPPYSPADALKTFTIEPGFRIESFASEPDIRSPVAMEFDENGRIYVVEAPGYPLKMDAKVGSVILLEDADHN